MYSERIQLLVSREQKRRLEQEARQRGTSVASVIREAVDGHLGPFSREDRMQALERIRGRTGVPFLTPEEINRSVEREREEELEEMRPIRRR